MDNKPNEKKTQTRSRKKKAAPIGRDASVATQGVCTKAPEWAEHSRLADEDQPCDDGRSGRHDD